MNAYPPTNLLRMSPCRVWRCYTGGYLLDAFVGNMHPHDSHTPEDWLASTVPALNGPHAQGPDEGLARVCGEDGAAGPLFRDVIATDPTAYLGRAGAPALDVLCKFLDSAVRLPMQCHPDRAFAREFYHSDHGKAESWIVLDTREIDGEAPYLLMGFQPGIRRENFIAAVQAQDIPAMERMLHKIPVHAGETYFIPGRFPHAIGPGVFMLEVQEPSDWVVQPEAFCAGTALSSSDMWGPLTPEQALECFDYRGETRDEVIARTRQTPQVESNAAAGSIERIIGPTITRCFGVQKITVRDHFTAACDAPYHIEVVVAGAGTLQVGEKITPVTRGDVLFVPFGVKAITYSAADGELATYRCMGSASD